MKFEEFLPAVAAYYEDSKPHQRYGQALFNTLHKFRPDLSKEIRGDRVLDPFYVDDRVPACLGWLEEHW